MLALLTRSDAGAVVHNQATNDVTSTDDARYMLKTPIKLPWHSHVMPLTIDYPARFEKLEQAEADSP